ncbi:hypothetical protein bas12_0078 [Escherichia phage BrunoManser]|uniref:Uncharacterized protein n=2 Tax=Sertoctavirus TaxID=2560227 RepID=A0AAE7VQ02_9CAUD|nr:hypothetical protein FDI72_gp40 [Escherichia phage SRT8]ATN93817.1 hypothetical protein [Escherichia phage SRT8]QXV76560.1 hypothetical protein bas12_0078 [Escherichia phage BrunoManser]
MSLLKQSEETKMICTGKVYFDKHGNEYELIFTDDGDFMYDGCDQFIEVRESDYSEGAYYDRKDVRRFFTKEKPE